MAEGSRWSPGPRGNDHRKTASAGPASGVPDLEDMAAATTHAGGVLHSGPPAGSPQGKYLRSCWSPCLSRLIASSVAVDAFGTPPGCASIKQAFRWSFPPFPERPPATFCQPSGLASVSVGRMSKLQRRLQAAAASEMSSLPPEGCVPTPLWNRTAIDEETTGG